MKASFRPSSERHSGFWDAAAGGIFPGLLGGMVMLVVLIASGLLMGHTPAQVMGAFDPSGRLPLRGVLIHLAVSCVYGTLFALLSHGLVIRLRFFYGPPGSASIALLGTLYGFVLWLVAVSLLRQAAASLLAIAPSGVFLLAHLFYGLTLGMEAKRQMAGAITGD